MANGKQRTNSNRPLSTGKPGTGGGQPRTPRAATPTQAAGSTSGSALPDLPKRTNVSSASSASTSAAARPAVRTSVRQAPPRRRSGQQVWWRTPWATIGTFVSIVLLIALMLVLAHIANGGNSTDGKPVSPEVFKQITQVSPQVSAAVGTGGLRNPLTPVTPKVEVLKDASGKPQIVYVGTDWCPFCAAQRWSIIVAMSRFGTFSNLQYMSSSSTDTYPNTPTFSFYKSSYTSQYINFAGVEMQDRDGNSLQPLTDAQQKLMAKYDAPPYTQSAGGFPFMDFGNQYLTLSSGFLPSSLANQSQATIAKALSDPNAASTQGIVGNANYLTAAVCQLINDSAPACKVAPIPTIEQQLPKNG